MKKVAEAWLQRSKAALEAARRDLDAGAGELAADRAYYTMFYAVRAVLSTRGLDYSSHGATHAGFGKEFAKTRELDPKYHRWLIDAFDERQKAIYGVHAEVPVERARELIDQAEEFLEAARSYCEAHPEAGSANE